MKIDELTEKYLSEIKNIRRYSDNTIKSYRTDLEEFLCYCIEKQKTELSGINEKIHKILLNDSK